MKVILKLVSENPKIDFFNTVMKIANGQDVNFKGFEVSEMTAGFYDYLKEIQEHIIEHGMSSLLTIETINDSLIPKGATTDKIILTMQRYLDRIGIDKELIIVDGYFFSTTADTTYATTIFDVLEKYLATIENLIFVTKNKVDTTLKSSIESKLKARKPSLTITHHTTDNYHDRFWISNHREKGIITGTSLNGFGRKFSLIDRLNTTDVRDIVASLTTQGLL
ncbi:MAG: hypothetical protein EOO51_00245 [Flavobacterium sp.]|nr:MAG: hypothetical protein EOO51_00245 [Flavobacterium sp.]